MKIDRMTVGSFLAFVALCLFVIWLIQQIFGLGKL